MYEKQANNTTWMPPMYTSKSPAEVEDGPFSGSLRQVNLKGLKVAIVVLMLVRLVTYMVLAMVSDDGLKEIGLTKETITVLEVSLSVIIVMVVIWFGVMIIALTHEIYWLLVWDCILNVVNCGTELVHVFTPLKIPKSGGGYIELQRNIPYSTLSIFYWFALALLTGALTLKIKRQRQ